MSNFTRHVGKTKNDTKVAVVFTQIPDDEENALVVDLDSLENDLQDDLNFVLFSDEGQNSKHLYDILHRRSYRQGGSLLEALHYRRKLMKKSIDDIIMTPNQFNTIVLRDLIEQIRMLESGDNRTNEQIEYDRNIKKKQLMEREHDDKHRIGQNLLREAAELEEQAKLLKSDADRKRENAKMYLEEDQNHVQEQTTESNDDVNYAEREQQAMANKGPGRPKGAKNKKKTGDLNVDELVANSTVV